jgi:hypothetical protein
MFNPHEINQTEREMCSYLEWELPVDNAILANFQAIVKREEGQFDQRYDCAMITQSTPPPSDTSTSPIPSFGHRNLSPPIQVLPPPFSSATSMSTSFSNARSSSHGQDVLIDVLIMYNLVHPIIILLNCTLHTIENHHILALFVCLLWYKKSQNKGKEKRKKLSA